MLLPKNFSIRKQLGFFPLPPPPRHFHFFLNNCFIFKFAFYVKLRRLFSFLPTSHEPQFYGATSGFKNEDQIYLPWPCFSYANFHNNRILSTNFAGRERRKSRYGVKNLEQTCSYQLVCSSCKLLLHYGNLNLVFQN